MAYNYSSPHESIPDFTAIFNRKLACPSSGSIPKIAHFVHAEVRELTWLDWATVRGAIVNLGVENVYIWLPVAVELKGWIWNRVLEMPEVKLRRISMPTMIYGTTINKPERQADVARLKILYEEGGTMSTATRAYVFKNADHVLGICLDSDLIPLKSSDDVIYDNSTRATVMAQQYRGDDLPNGFIMSKPRSPFIKRWIQQYKEVEKRNIWDQLSATRPYAMWMNKDPDLTVLDGHAWFYPLSADEDGDVTLKQLWFGKSWHDVEKSYGTHFWHPTEKFAKLITPLTIRTIDTPLFCSVRKLFDNLDDDGYYAEYPTKNANCSISWTKDLEHEDHRMFSDYQISTDDVDRKWIDSSGFNNHAWAPNGMTLLANETSGTRYRNISALSYAVLPVPADWDSRVWSARMNFGLDTHDIAQGDGVGLFKIRMEIGGEILVRASNDYFIPETTVIVEWKGNELAKKEVRSIDDFIWDSQVGLPDLRTGPHELTITLDRKDQGAVNLFLDGKQLANKTIPTIASPKIAQDIWFNAQDWSNLDTGFRGRLERFTMYADILSPEDAAMPIARTSGTSSMITKLSPSMHSTESTTSPWAVLFPCTAVLLFLLYLLRRKKGFLLAIPEYANRLPELANSLPLLAGRISELAMNDLPALVKTVPHRAMELAERIPWLNTSKPAYVVAATEENEEGKEPMAEDGFHDTELGMATIDGSEEELRDPKSFE